MSYMVRKHSYHAVILCLSLKIGQRNLKKKKKIMEKCQEDGSKTAHCVQFQSQNDPKILSSFLILKPKKVAKCYLKVQTSIYTIINDSVCL